MSWRHHWQKFHAATTPIGTNFVARKAPQLLLCAATSTTESTRRTSTRTHTSKHSVSTSNTGVNVEATLFLVSAE
jgi:hypothetical protein